MGSPTKKIGRNTLFNAMGKFWQVGLNLAIVPFILAKLGTEVYGVWVLALVVGGSFTFFDFGLGASIVKFVSQNLALGNFEEINKIVNSGASFFSVFSVLFCICLYPLLPWLATAVFQIPLTLMEPALFALRFSLVAFVFAGLSNLYQSVLLGTQRMGLANGIVICVSIFQTLGILLVLHAGFALKGMIVNFALFTLVQASSMMIGARRAIPVLTIKFRYITKDALRTLFAYGLKLQVGASTTFLIEQLNKVFIVSLAGLQAVASFDVAMKVINIVRLLPLLPLSALVPSVSELYTLGDRQRLRALYIRGTKYLVAVLIPVSSIAILAAFPAMKLLFGKNSERAAYTVQILAVAYGFNLFTGMGTTMARGFGKPDLEMYYALVSAVLNIVLVYALGLWFGYFGLLAGMAIAVVAGSLYFIFKFHKISDEVFGKMDWELGKSLLTIMIPTFIAFFVNHILTVWHLSSSPYSHFQPWIVISLFVLLYAVMLFKFRFFDAYDRNLLRSIFQFR